MYSGLLRVSLVASHAGMGAHLGPYPSRLEALLVIWYNGGLGRICLLCTQDPAKWIIGAFRDISVGFGSLGVGFRSNSDPNFEWASR